MDLSKNNLVEISVEKFNFIKISGKEYFIYSRSKKEHFLVNARCPHRGGPINLGCLVNVNEKQMIQCPWHKNTFNLEKLIARDYIVKVVSNKKIQIKLKESDDINNVFLMKKRIILNES